VKGRFARQCETVSSRSKSVSLVFNSWQEVMQYMMIVRYYSVEERFGDSLNVFPSNCSVIHGVV